MIEGVVFTWMVVLSKLKMCRLAGLDREFEFHPIWFLIEKRDYA